MAGLLGVGGRGGWVVACAEQCGAGVWVAGAVLFLVSDLTFLVYPVQKMQLAVALIFCRRVNSEEMQINVQQRTLH